MSSPKKFSIGSGSFLRHKTFAEGLNVDNNFIQNSSKMEVKRWLHQFNYDEREVFFAENLNTKTLDELKKIKKDLSKYILRRLKEEGYSEKEIQKIKGIVELHPTGKDFKEDPTMINSHIHYWGGSSLIIKPFINEFIAKYKLSNRIKNDYSCSFMESGSRYIQGRKGEFYSEDEKKIYIEDDVTSVYNVISNVSMKEWNEGFEKEKEVVVEKQHSKSYNEFFDRLNKQISNINSEIEEIKRRNQLFKKEIEKAAEERKSSKEDKKRRQSEERERRRQEREELVKSIDDIDSKFLDIMKEQNKLISLHNSIKPSNNDTESTKSNTIDNKDFRELLKTIKKQK